MKVKSLLNFNTSLLARHTNQEGQAKVVIGGALPEYMIVPAGSTVELADSEWEKFKESAAPLLESGHLVLTEAPKLSEADQEKADEAELAKTEAKLSSLKAKKTKPKISSKPATKPAAEE